MRLPNGFGTIYKLQGHRRRPFVVKKTIAGKQKPLGYFSTHDEALTFLLKYNHEPTGLTATFADIYEQWKPTKWPALSESSRAAYENSFRHLSRLHDKTMSRLKRRETSCRIRLNDWIASGTGTGNWLAKSAYYWGDNEEYCDIEGPLFGRRDLYHNNVSPSIAAHLWKRVS